jgi:hypothetical protein
MGYGGYSYEAHQAITQKRAALPSQAVFTQRQIHPLMSPIAVKLRESRDSADHPHTTSIVFALDVSGSMGAIPEQIAKKELPGFMKALLAAGVTDPQVLFMALHDCADLSKKAPLQVGQFESTAELIDQWLTWCWLMGGGMSEHESYDLAMFFAARHTKLDSLEKRGKRGYFFMTGDETCYPALKAKWAKEFLGDEVVVGDKHDADLPLAAIVADLRRTYQPFFLVPDPQRGAKVQPFWRQHFGEAAITLGTPEDTCPVAAAAIALTEGVVPSLSAVAEKLAEGGLSPARVARVRTALTPYAATLGKV